MVMGIVSSVQPKLQEIVMWQLPRSGVGHNRVRLIRRFEARESEEVVPVDRPEC